MLIRENYNLFYKNGSHPETKENERMEKRKRTKSKKLLKKQFRILASVTALALAAFVLFQGITVEEKLSEPEVNLQATLQEVVYMSKLSTFSSVYNGVAEVKNEKKPDKTDYYVSYEAEVKAGFDFKEIDITVDDTTKTVKIKIPETYEINVNVDITSLAFIFLNDKANTSAVTEQAFKACKADAQRESEQQGAICALAKKNAENVLKALTNPIIEQLYPEYELGID